MLTATTCELAKLTYDPNNPRVHDERNIAAIKNSLTEFGQVAPLVVQAGTRRVIGGNGTMAAMRALGWHTADVVYVDVDDTRAAALSVALNRTAELGTWNTEVLGKILEGLHDLSPETIGFSEDEMRRLVCRDLDLGMMTDEEEEEEGGGDHEGLGQPGREPEPGNGGVAAPVQHVRLVQLFFNEEQHETFISITDRLAEQLGTGNLSDTVMAAVQKYHSYSQA